MTIIFAFLRFFIAATVLKLQPKNRI